MSCSFQKSSVYRSLNNVAAIVTHQAVQQDDYINKAQCFCCCYILIYIKVVNVRISYLV